MPDKGWFAVPNLLLSKLYFNSLLVSLNSRNTLKAHVQAKMESQSFGFNGSETATGTRTRIRIETFKRVEISEDF